MEAGGTHAPGIERIPFVAAATRPAVFFAGCPAAEWAADTWAGGVEAFVFFKLAIQDHGGFAGVIGEGPHAQLL